MKKHKPDEKTPDVGAEVLGYFGEQLGFVIVRYCMDGDWIEPWSSDIVSYDPEYWVDLADIEDSLK